VDLAKVPEAKRIKDLVLADRSPLKREKRTQSGHRSGDR
jgi:hypothetical protein